MGVDTTIFIAYGFLIDNAREFYKNIEEFEKLLDEINEKYKSSIRYAMDGYNISQYNQIFIYIKTTRNNLFNQKTGSITGGLGNNINKENLELCQIKNNEKDALEEVYLSFKDKPFFEYITMDYYVYYYQW